MSIKKFSTNLNFELALNAKSIFAAKIIKNRENKKINEAN